MQWRRSAQGKIRAKVPVGDLGPSPAAETRDQGPVRCAHLHAATGGAAAPWVTTWRSRAAVYPAWRSDRQGRPGGTDGGP